MTQRASKSFSLLTHSDELSLDSYLQQNGFLDVTSQNAIMALYCIDYLLSQPFSLITTKEDLRTFAERGYYALLSYASAYWLDHLLKVLIYLQQPQALMNNHPRLADQIQVFLRDMDMLDPPTSKNLDQEPTDLAQIVCNLLTDIASRNDWLQLEIRIERAIETIEILAEEARDHSPSTVEDQTLAIYGKLSYRCSKLGCNYLQSGFASRSQREVHLDRHRRPFLCSEAHCLYASLGFVHEVALNRHISQRHTSEQPRRPTFPQPAGKSMGLLEAINSGDTEVAIECCKASGWRTKELTKALTSATQHGQLDVCKALLTKGASFSREVLLATIKSDDLTVVDYYLSLDEPVPNVANVLGRFGCLMLEFAIRSRAGSIVKYILDNGAAYVEGVIPSQEHAIHTAVNVKDRDIIRMLLADGHFKLNCLDVNHRTPIHLAASSGDEIIVSLLLAERGLDLNIGDKSGETPLLSAVKRGNSMIVDILLANAKTDPDIGDESGETPLLIAVKKGEFMLVDKLLVDKRVDPDKEDHFKWTPLMYASLEGNDRIVEKLLETGRVNPNHADKYGQTALLYATKSRSTKATNLLLDYPAIEPSPLSSTGITPFLEAVMYDMNEMIPLFLARKDLDVNQPSIEGETPLMIASKNGNERIVKMLLDTGKVDVDMECKGRTAADYARDRKADSLTRLDYQQRLMLIEEQNKKRLLMARQRQDNH